MRGGHCTKFYEVVLEAEGGTPHIPIWNIWSNVQTRVGTPHKILRIKSRSLKGGWVGGGLMDRWWVGPTDYKAHSGSQFQLSIQVRAECGNICKIGIGLAVLCPYTD